MEQNYLQHYGILGMHWGVRRYQNADGTLTSAGKSRYKTAKDNYKSTEKEYSKSFHKAYSYASNHPIASNFTEKGKKKSDEYWNDAYDKAEIAKNAKSELNSAKKQYKTEKKQINHDVKTYRRLEDAIPYSTHLDSESFKKASKTLGRLENAYDYSSVGRTKVNEYLEEAEIVIDEQLAKNKKTYDLTKAAEYVDKAMKYMDDVAFNNSSEEQ